MKRLLAPRVSLFASFLMLSALAGCGRSALPATGSTDGGDASAADGGDAHVKADGAPGTDAAGTDGGSSKAIARIELAPPTLTLAQGTGAPLTVTADYTDGTSADVTAESTLVSSAPAVASVTGETVLAAAPGSATITATYRGQTATSTVTVTSATLQSISIDPAMPKLAVGTSVDLAATGVFSDGSKQDISAIATWTSSNGAVATVAITAAGGHVKAVAPGTTTVTATLLKTSASTTVTVTAAIIQSIDITPSHPTVPVGIVTQLTATATYSDNSTQDISTQATWTVSDATIATIDATGKLSPNAMGSVDVQAAFGGVTGKTTVIVMGTSLASIQVTPATALVPAGIPQPFAATGTYSDGSMVDITQSVSWSTDGAAASVSNAAGAKGVATGISAGTVHVQAALGTITGAATLSISSAIVTSLAVAPKTAMLPIGFTQTFTATATYSDGSTRDVTALAVWSSSDATVATVANSTSGTVTSGMVTSVKVGMVTITAGFGGATDTAAVTTTAAVITSITVAPPTVTTAAGGQQPFTATAQISDGTTSDVTTQVTWSSSAPAVVAVSNAAGSKGLATSVSKGTATITATLGGVKGSAEFDVTGPVLKALQVTPFLASITVGGTQAYVATAIFSDGSTQNVTATATWVSSDESLATVAAAAGMGPMMGMGAARPVVATGVDAGTVTIEARYMGLATDVTLTITAQLSLVSVAVTPPSATVRVGQNQGFVATAIYSDGSTVNVTGASTWSSSDATVATVANAGMGMGMGPGGGGGAAAGAATGVAAGAVTITATYMTFSGSAKLTVTAPQLVGVQVSPATAALIVGHSLQFQAIALLDDGTRQTVTTAALWSSSSSDVLAVSDAAGGGVGPGGGGAGTPKGDATALTAGMATVTATYMGLSGTSQVTVSMPTLVSVQVTPTDPTLAKGASLQFAAVALYSDYSTVNVTNTATWSTEAPTIATITSGMMGRGRATAFSSGMTVVTAAYGGISGTTTLTVTDPQIVSIAITPASSTIPVGINPRLTATATLTDGTTNDVTNAATWTSSDPTIAALSNAMGSQGAVTSLTPGGVTVTATYMSISGTTTLTVSTATLMSIAVTGASGALAAGAHAQLTATGTYSDNSTFDLTKQATWISTMTGVATVSNAGGSQGLLTAVANGSTTIEAHFDDVVGTASATVGP